jgi:hypothetical protein
MPKGSSSNEPRCPILLDLLVETRKKAKLNLTLSEFRQRSA